MKGFGPLFRLIADKARALLADHGYDTNAIREEIAFPGGGVVIPAKRGRRNPVLHTATSITSAAASNTSSTNSRTGVASPPAMTKPRESSPGFVNLVPALLWLPFVHENKGRNSFTEDMRISLM